MPEDPETSDATDPDGTELATTEPTGRESASRPDLPPAPSHGRTAAIGVLVVALIAAVAFAYIQRQEASDLQAELDQRSSVAATAGAFGEAYLTYDFDDPEGNVERVRDLASPDFAEDFSTTRAPGLEELFSNLQTTTSARTTEVFVSDVSDGAARALVAVDLEASSAASGTQRLTNLTFVVDMVEVDGEWLVDRVNPAPQPDLSGDGVEQPGDQTTTTTAPTSTAPAPTTTAAP